MKIVNIEGAKKPLFSWCESPDKNAMDQMISVAKLPFVEHVAIMPDCHFGNGVSVGSVVATKNTIVPNFVGVDIACGMSCLKTNLFGDEIEDKKEIIHHAVERSIPTGFSHNTDQRRKEIEDRVGDKINFLFEKYATETKIVDRKEIASQLGTLGGG